MKKFIFFISQSVLFITISLPMFAQFHNLPMDNGLSPFLKTHLAEKLDPLDYSNPEVLLRDEVKYRLNNFVKNPVDFNALPTSKVIDTKSTSIFKGSVPKPSLTDTSWTYSTHTSSYQGTTTGPGPNGGYPGTPRGMYNTIHPELELK